MGRPFFNAIGPSQIFSVPYVQPKQYRPGRQPNSPGESQIDTVNPHYTIVPWPNVVPTLSTLANNPGTPRNRAMQATNNSTAPGLSNYLFIGGFAGKSKG